MRQLPAPQDFSAEERDIWTAAQRVLRAQGTWDNDDAYLLRIYTVNIARGKHAHAATASLELTSLDAQYICNLARDADKAALEAARERAAHPGRPPTPRDQPAARRAHGRAARAHRRLMGAATGLHVRPGLRGLEAFCELIDEPLEPFERRIARAHFGLERELVAVLPRGNLKTTLAAKIGLHHLLTVPGAAVTLGASSRDQARIAFERLRGFAWHPGLADDLVVRHLEVRYEDDGQLRLLRAIPSDGPRAHGLSSTLYVGDELWAWKGDDLLEAMQTGL